jgi:hypothetical protein
MNNYVCIGFISLIIIAYIIMWILAKSKKFGSFIVLQVVKIQVSTFVTGMIIFAITYLIVYLMR